MADSLLKITRELTEAVRDLQFAPPVAYVYNPLDYAAAPHRDYLKKFGEQLSKEAGRTREVLFLGMNPGPWGMAQTGVPFGAVEPVRDWLGVRGKVGKPEREHPKRPVTGFDCPRNEVSGARIWGWARDLFTTPERFFARFYVANYCPLLFLDAAGRNLTPDKLRAADRDVLLPPCDCALRRTAEVLGVRRAVGVGVWAEQRARHALAGLDLEFGRILHPSPASPAANHGWAEAATRELREQGIVLP